MTRVRRVFLLQDLVPSYRVPVYRRLAQAEGIDLTVFYSAPSRSDRDENLRNADDISGFQAVRLASLQLGRHAYQFGFLRHVLARRPDSVIMGQMGRLDTSLCLALCKLLSIRVLWFHGGVPYKDPERIRAVAQAGILNRWFGRHNPVRRIIFRGDAMIVYSDHAREYFAAMGFPRRKIWVAPNSPDTDALRRAEARVHSDDTVLRQLRNRYAPNGERVILTLGRLNQARKVDVLIEAFTRLRRSFPGVVLLIAGDGPERLQLEARTRANESSQVHFLGALYDEEALAPYFMLCDLFVTPGVASLAIKFAMALGKPVVTVDHGLEVHAIRDGENGYVVPINDPDALADAILPLLQDEALCENIGANARKTIDEQINIQKMVNGFQEAICATDRKPDSSDGNR